MPLRERDILEFARSFAARGPSGRGLLVGIGDDAAVADAQGRALVVTTDMLIDGVDFVVAECGFEAAGRKAMNKNLSDIAAMGCEPWLAFAAVALPGGVTEDQARQLFDGLTAAGVKHGCALAGGDTKRSRGGLVVSVTIVGRARGKPPLLRSGARAGDAICVTGPCGGSILGHHLAFAPRVVEGLALNELHGAHAAIDLSDGLACDVAQVAIASGLGAVLDADAIPIAAAAHELAARDGRTALDHALHDGEDYELVVALPESEVAGACAALPLTRIGVFTQEPGLFLRRGAALEPLEPGGYEHRFDGAPS